MMLTIFSDIFPQRCKAVSKIINKII